MAIVSRDKRSLVEETKNIITVVGDYGLQIIEDKSHFIIIGTKKLNKILEVPTRGEKIK